MARIRKLEEEPGLFSPGNLVVVTPMLYEAVLNSVKKMIKKELKAMTAQYLMEVYRRHAKGGASIVMHYEMITMAMFKKDPELALEIFHIEGSFITARLRFPISGEASRINAFLEEIVYDLGLERRAEVVCGELEIQIQLAEGNEPKLDPEGTTDRHRRRAYCCAREIKNAKQLELERWFEDECKRRASE